MGEFFSAHPLCQKKGGGTDALLEPSPVETVLAELLGQPDRAGISDRLSLSLLRPCSGAGHFGDPLLLPAFGGFRDRLLLLLVFGMAYQNFRTEAGAAFPADFRALPPIWNPHSRPLAGHQDGSGVHFRGKLSLPRPLSCEQSESKCGRTAEFQSAAPEKRRRESARPPP